ncbi:hypothetical protein SAMN06265784_11374 [Paraburkholderia susongensis]|uniref:Uncharacterized protein n=2 Tax=Paraburkholderia susongensis TaxID=1515439 RepID=A0A1X7M2B6_9BURK|nr:hypothetical protein SAMN06265784_11374 [Paraburkholderia susongensis]
MLSAGGLSPAMAEDKAMDTKGDRVEKILLENDKVQVREATWKPGQIRAVETVGNRVVRVKKGGTLLRIYLYGKTNEIVFKTGDVKWFDESNGSTTAYSIKNVGKTEVVLYAVVLK